VDFSFEHPIEEIGRVLYAVLLKHLGLGYVLLPTFKKVNILYKEPRVRTLVKKVIKDLKCGRHTSEIQKPEDIVNATIQSQSERHKSNEDVSKSTMKKTASDGKISESKSETDDVNNEIKNGTQKTPESRTESINSNSVKVEPKNAKSCVELEDKWNVEKIENDARTEQSEEDKEKKLEDDIALSGIVSKLTEKQMKKVCSENLELMSSILDFVMQDTCDVEILRKAMYFQVRFSVLSVVHEGAFAVKQKMSKLNCFGNVRRWRPLRTLDAPE
jgi:E3 ubiquitin-protein ligase HERC2